MNHADPRAEATAQAIELLTVTYEGSNNHMSDLEDALYQEALERDGAASLFVGMTNVVTWLLVKLENATGQTKAEILRDIARKNQAR